MNSAVNASHKNCSAVQKYHWNTQVHYIAKNNINSIQNFSAKFTFFFLLYFFEWMSKYCKTYTRLINSKRRQNEISLFALPKFLCATFSLVFWWTFLSAHSSLYIRIWDGEFLLCSYGLWQSGWKRDGVRSKHVRIQKRWYRYVSFIAQGIYLVRDCVQIA